MKAVEARSIARSRATWRTLFIAGLCTILVVFAPIGGCARGPATRTTAERASHRDVVYGVCSEVYTRKFQAEGHQEESGAMAHLLCQLAAGRCKENPGDDACRKTLRELDADLKTSDSSMVFAAAHSGRTDIVATMINMGSDPNAAVAGGWTPLLIAAAEGHETTVAALLDAGANPNVKNNVGRTALMFASSKGFTPIVKKLLAARADTNVVANDDTGWTALMVAARMGYLETVRALLGGGADVMLKDKSGNTALALAEAQGHSAVARLLREHGR